jgi:phage shock protein A
LDLHFFRSNSTCPRICIATASVAKFQEAVKIAGVPVQNDDRVTALQNMETKYEDMEKGDDWGKILKNKIVEINA